MNIERDRFLLSKIDNCEHERKDQWVNGYNFFHCSKCGMPHRVFEKRLQIDFSTWSGFGELLEWCQTQDDEFLWNNKMSLSCLSPNGFADVIYASLKVKQ